MGAWGYEIFENDDACDVRDRFNQSIRNGMSAAEAASECAKWWPDCLQDMDALLALAALQMEKKALQPEIKAKCLRMIEEERDVSQWSDPEKRKRVLASFRQKLLHYRN